MTEKRLSMRVRDNVPKSIINLRLPVELIEWIQQEMRERDRSSSWIVAEALQLARGMQRPKAAPNSSSGGVQQCSAN